MTPHTFLDEILDDDDDKISQYSSHEGSIEGDEDNKCDTIWRTDGNGMGVKNFPGCGYFIATQETFCGICGPQLNFSLE